MHCRLLKKIQSKCDWKSYIGSWFEILNRTLIFFFKPCFDWKIFHRARNRVRNRLPDQPDIDLEFLIESRFEISGQTLIQNVKPDPDWKNRSQNPLTLIDCKNQPGTDKNLQTGSRLHIYQQTSIAFFSPDREWKIFIAYRIAFEDHDRNNQTLVLNFNRTLIFIFQSDPAQKISIAHCHKKNQPYLDFYFSTGLRLKTVIWF